MILSRWLSSRCVLAHKHIFVLISTMEFKGQVPEALRYNSSIGQYGLSGRSGLDGEV